MIRKYEIVCQSENEMDRRADALLERGYKVERVTGVMPLRFLVFITYKVIFWK